MKDENIIDIAKFVKPERKKKVKKDRLDVPLVSGLVIVALVLVLSGVAYAFRWAIDWGAGHQIVGQRIFDVSVRWPFRVEARQKTVVISPLSEKIAQSKLSTTEQVIVDKWEGDYKTAMLAVAIFDCGESGLNPEAVSKTGDLGVAQINWPINGKMIKEKLGYSPADMFDVKKNIDSAYLIWDRGDGEEGNKEGSWEAWVGFTSGAYTKCFK